jgi:protocadherin alpha
MYCENLKPPESWRAKCESLFHCVLCKLHNTGPLSQQQCDTNCTASVTAVDAFEENSTDINCEESYNDCLYEFQFQYVNSSVDKIEALRGPKCVVLRGSFVPVIMAIFGAIVFLGILMIIIWKLVAARKDRLEFEKFKKEQESSKWGKGTSPLYVPPVTEFQNPVYGVIS